MSYAQQLGLRLELQYPQPVALTETGTYLSERRSVGGLRKSVRADSAKIESERWQGKLIAEDEECFVWLSD